MPVKDDIPRNQVKSRNTIEQREHEDDAAARRVVNVDQNGDFITETNPLFVRLSDGSISIETLNANLAVQLSAKDNDPKPGDVHDSVRIGDGTNEMKVNPDGSINVVFESSSDVNKRNILSVFSQALSVASGITIPINTYVVPIGSNFSLARVLVSGENVARFDVLINGTTVATQRSFFGGDLGKVFTFASSDGTGLLLNSSDVIVVNVLHTRPYVADFEATIELIANPTMIPGETPIFAYNEITLANSGTTYNIVSYTVMPGKTATLQRVLVSGDNIARYDVFVNSGTLATQRTYFGGNLDKTFEFAGAAGGGVLLNTGDVVTVKVLHNRPNSANFEATIEAIEYA